MYGPSTSLNLLLIIRHYLFYKTVISLSVGVAQLVFLFQCS